jgi:hypothetical protein
VIDCLGTYLYRLPFSKVQQYLREGRMFEVPWKGTRAVIAAAEHAEYIKRNRPPLGQRYTHRGETEENTGPWANIRGVWAFKKPPESHAA